MDDFVGSGDQCVATWRREYELADGNLASFDQFSTVRGTNFFYCPVLCAEMGLQVIERDCAALKLRPAHFISSRYNAFSEESIVWPDHLRPGAVKFLETASRRAGIAESDIAGYGGLGLTIALEGAVPDATLPIFYHDRNGWKPLVRRK